MRAILRRSSYLFLLAFAACHRTGPPANPLPHRAYVWQREWTPAVRAAVKQAAPKLQGLVVFGTDVSWANRKPKVLRCHIDWQSLHDLHQPVGLAMRIAPWPGPFDDASITQLLVSEARVLMDQAKTEQVQCTEFQVDFDCAQKKLDGYALWLKALREAVKPTRFAITSLPAWLDEPALSRVLDEVDGWVLQVHSVMPEKAEARVAACDPRRARIWVEKAARLRHPFEVALSTYSAQAGYSDTGKLLGLALDGVQPAWPDGTRIMQFDSDADELSALVQEWKLKHPPGMTGFLWYRLPVATDQRNWRWPTLAAVIEGRTPTHHLKAVTTSENPVDLSLVNDGEANEDLSKTKIRITWQGVPPTATEALPGWKIEHTSAQSLVIVAVPPAPPSPPGGRRSIGWLRFETPTSPQVEIVK